MSCLNCSFKFNLLFTNNIGLLSGLISTVNGREILSVSLIGSKVFEISESLVLLFLPLLSKLGLISSANPLTKLFSSITLSLKSNVSKLISFIVNSNQKEVLYDFKRGDVYSYLRLYTDQKIRMYEFNNTPDIQQIIVRCLSLKFARAQGNMPLTEVYNSFMRKKYNKQLLKLIKENKIGEI